MSEDIRKGENRGEDNDKTCAWGCEGSTVQELCARFNLVLSNLSSLAPIVGDDELLETNRPCNVAPLPNVCKHTRGVDFEGLQTTQSHVIRVIGNGASWLHATNAIGKRLDVVRRRAAASTNGIYQAVLRPLLERLSHVFGVQIIATHSVRQPYIHISSRHYITSREGARELSSGVNNVQI